MAMLTKLPEQVMQNPLVVQSMLLSLLHMLSEFIAIQPITDRTLLRSLMGAVETFCKWPLPYCVAAHNALQLLATELQLWLDILIVDVVGEN